MRLWKRTGSMAAAAWLLGCGCIGVRADLQFFRVVGPSQSRITDFDRGGWLTWTNVVSGGTYTVVRTTSLLAPVEWTSLLSVVVTNEEQSAWVMSAGMIALPAGAFAMGNSVDNGEGWIDELPVHTVQVSAVRMDRHEVSLGLWRHVATWATAHGYGFSGQASGKDQTHPVVNVNWTDCLKWCNARSQMEGLTPCYYVNATLTTVYTNGVLHPSNDWVRWDADGYRLPTEAEWEYAARGGAGGHRFPWTGVEAISHGMANYYSYWEDGSPYYPYDEASSEGHHPAFSGGADPLTGPTGSFVSNGFGLHDMAGNVWEWCWDWYDQGWYINAACTLDDTRGPDTGETRTARGGSWIGDAFSARCAARLQAPPSRLSNDTGFRCVRR